MPVKSSPAAPYLPAAFQSSNPAGLPCPRISSEKKLFAATTKRFPSSARTILIFRGLHSATKMSPDPSATVIVCCEAEGTARLSPQTPVSDNGGGVFGEKKYASVTIEYTVAVEGAESITLRVSDSYAWTDVDADVQDYVNSHIKCRLYAEGGQPPEWGAAGAAEYALPVITPGATGTVTLDVMLDLSEELAPPELKDATLTVRVGVEKTTSGESA